MGSSRIGKILTVAILVGSASFMGFALVTNFAGPNWKQKAEEFSDYNFAPPTGEGGSWTVTARTISSEEVNKTKTLPGAYVSALKHRIQIDQARKTANDKASATLKTKIAEVEQLAQGDKFAIQKRVDSLNEAILKQNAESKLVSDQILAKTDEAQKLNEQIAVRREETERMSAQLEELRSQYAIMNEKKRRLNDLLIRAQGNLERARRRHELLKSDVEKTLLGN